MAATISLCMIVRNEEKVLARCLESVRGCVDEIVIVDTGSSDATKEIAARYTDRIYDFEWIDDFSAARNYAFEQATGDYLLWLDADDVLLPADAAALRRYKDEQLAGCDVVMLRYNTAFDELGRPTFFFYRERLIRRTLPHRWVGRVHEVVVHSGAVAYAEIAVTHKSVKAVYGDRNLRIYEKQIADGETLSPRELFYYGRELYYHGRYDDAQRVLLSFLGTGEGFLENCIDACLLLCAGERIPAAGGIPHRDSLVHAGDALSARRAGRRVRQRGRLRLYPISPALRLLRPDGRAGSGGALQPPCRRDTARKPAGFTEPGVFRIARCVMTALTSRQDHFDHFRRLCI